MIESIVLKKMVLFFVMVFPLESDFLKNIGSMVNTPTLTKMSQLRQSIKLTGVINARAAAAISPSTEKRNICMVRVK